MKPMVCQRTQWGQSERGFTLVELLVVIAVIAILAGLLLAGLGKAKSKVQGIRCLNNLSQLTLAWRLYTDDHQGRLLYASSWGLRSADPKTDPFTWVLGGMDFDPNNASNWSVKKDIQKSPMWPYCGNSVEIWKCPADKSVIRPALGPLRGQVVPRVRSVSMNLWVGGFGGAVVGESGKEMWRVYLNESDMIDPGPARTFLLLDMREDSIDWGNFMTDMHGWPDQPSETRFRDLPASYHNQSGGFSFADGHCETRRWKDPRTMPPLVKDGLIPDQFASAHNVDVIWLQERSTRAKD